jgi:hypothetical protein
MNLEKMDAGSGSVVENLFFEKKIINDLDHGLIHSFSYPCCLGPASLIDLSSSHPASGIASFAAKMRRLHAIDAPAGPFLKSEQ